LAHSGTTHVPLMPLKIFFVKLLFSEPSFRKVPLFSTKVHEWKKSLWSHMETFLKNKET